MDYNLPVFTQPLISNVIKLEQNPWTEKTNTTSNEYTTVEGDTLTSIALTHSTSVERLWRANSQLTDPNILEVNYQLKIPQPDENLPDRPLPIENTPEPPQNAPQSNSVDGLIGSIGYARAGGNCVSEPGVNSPRNGTNPISWTILSRTPTIGATALFRFNHTGVVVGIWEGGQWIEIRHQNYSGGRHKFHISEFRGFR